MVLNFVVFQVTYFHNIKVMCWHYITVELQQSYFSQWCHPVRMIQFGWYSDCIVFFNSRSNHGGIWTWGSQVEIIWAISPFQLYSFFAGWISPIYWSTVATCQVICVHMVQLTSSQTKILQKTREKDVTRGRTKMQRRANGM